MIDDVTAVVLAGGRATRFPDKLLARCDGAPLLERVVHNLEACMPVVIATRDVLDARYEPKLRDLCVFDRWPDRGPVAALLSSVDTIATTWIFAVAGDAPRVTCEVAEKLALERDSSCDAVVPEHGDTCEPLAAFYRRDAIARCAPDVLHGRASMHALLERMRLRRVECDATFFININTEAELVRMAQP